MLAVLIAAPGASSAIADQTVDLGGTPIEGATSLADATPVEAGLWSDTLGADEARGTHYFRYRRTTEDSSVHVSVLGSSSTGSDGLELNLLAEDDTDCSSSSGSSSYSQPEIPFGTGGVAGPDEAGDRESSCLRSDEVRFSVTRGASAEGDLEYAFKVVEEAPLGAQPAEEDLPSPTTPAGSPTIESLPGGADGTETGGRSFDDAPELSSGDSARPDLASGEIRFFKVRLEWGQRLSVNAEAPKLPEGAVDTWGYSTSMTLQVYDPMRRPTEPGAGAAFEDDVSLDDDQSVVATNGAGPVQYLGRFDGSTSYLPGDYWIAVGLKGSGEAAAQGDPIPVDLTLNLAGEASGAPSYARERPYLIGPDTWSAEPSGYASPPGAEDSSSSVARRVAAATLALAGVVCLAVAGLRLRRTTA